MNALNPKKSYFENAKIQTPLSSKAWMRPFKSSWRISASWSTKIHWNCLKPLWANSPVLPSTWSLPRMTCQRNVNEILRSKLSESWKIGKSSFSRKESRLKIEKSKFSIGMGPGCRPSWKVGEPRRHLGTCARRLVCLGAMGKAGDRSTRKPFWELPVAFEMPSQNLSKIWKSNLLLLIRKVQNWQKPTIAKVKPISRTGSNSKMQ